MLDNRTAQSRTRLAGDVAEVDEQLILVDESDRELRPAGKLDAHRSGALHRAFSVFVFRSDGRLVIQQRAGAKYHSPGKWANTCCGHPRPREETVAAAERRLMEELGMACRLQPGFCARYRAEFDNGLIENELVHVLFGVSDASAVPHPAEAAGVDAVSLDKLADEIAAAPDRFAVWLVRYFERHAAEIARHRDRILAGERPS